MKRNIHRELLEIFSHTEAAEDDAKDIALGEFADELQSYCRQEKDLAERTRTLRFASSELAVAQEQIHTGAGEKCAVAKYYNPSYWVNRLRTGHYQNETNVSRTVWTVL